MEVGSREAEGMLLAAFAVEPARVLRFRGRLDHLRRYGCPSGTNTGKGRAAAYGWGQLIELMLALTLLDLGIGPEHAARTLKANGALIRLALWQLFDGDRSRELAIASAKKAKWPIRKTAFLIGSVYALASMREDGVGSEPILAIVDYRQLVQRFETAEFVEASALVVDLGTRVASLIALVETWTKADLSDVVGDLKQWLDAAVNQMVELEQ